jgi:peptide methionine sulfoxide reductase MsrA
MDQALSSLIRRTSSGRSGALERAPEPVPAYFRAETYHQEYSPQHPNQGYCAAVIGPKVAKFRKTWADYRKA